MKKGILLLLIIISGSFISCERDDICAETTPTTPRLILRFFDNDMPEDLLIVNDLFAIALDNNDTINISGLVTMSTDSLTLPLRTDANQTRFALILSNNDSIIRNSDIVTVDYEREEVFISRACGFSTNFNNIMITVVPDADNWILDQSIIQGRENVTDETAAHVQIFH